MKPKLRIKLSGMFVKPDTAFRLAHWNEKGPSIGILVDRLTDFAKSEGFDPVLNATTSRKTK